MICVLLTAAADGWALRLESSKMEEMAILALDLGDIGGLLALDKLSCCDSARGSDFSKILEPLIYIMKWQFLAYNFKILI